MFPSDGKRNREEQQQHLQNLSKTPRLSDSPFRMLQIVDNRLQKHSEEIQKQTQTKLKELFLESEARLLCEIDKRMNEMKTEIGNVITRVTKLEALTSEIVNDKLSEIRLDITNIIERVGEVETSSAKSNGATMSYDLQSEVGKLRLQLLQQENLAVSCDLRINGIPRYENENLFDLFHYLCQKLDIKTPNVISIYRVKSKNPSPASTILVKLMCPFDRNVILKTISTYRRKSKDLLILNVLNFDSNEPFYVNENLTKTNYTIFNEALKLKKRNVFSTVFTLRGIVHVKEKDIDNPIPISNVAELKTFFLNHHTESET